MTKYLNICLVLKSADQDVHVFYSACKCIQISGIMPSILAPGTVSLTGNRVLGDNGKHCAYCTLQVGLIYTAEVTLCLQLLSADNLCKQF